MSDFNLLNLAQAFEGLSFVGDRTPESSDEDLAGAFAQIADYRNGGIFIGHYAGSSQWERHSHGDEIVHVVDGETTIYLLTDHGEVENVLQAGEMLVVPQHTWHRFDTPKGVKVLTVTPQPTEHSLDQPGL